MKKNKLLIIIGIFIFLLSLNVKADTFDFTKKGSITIDVIDDNSKPLTDLELTLYKIGEAYEKDNNLSFKYVSKLNSCKVLINDITTSNVDEVYSCLKDKNIEKIINKTDKNGSIKFSNLSLGLYLVEQTNKIEGYNKLDKFIIMLPNITNNGYEYDVHSTPKCEIEKFIDITIKKVWNSGNSKIPRVISVELFKGEELIQLVNLSIYNNWEYTLTNLPASDDYYVKEFNILPDYVVTYKRIGNTFIVTNTNTLVQTGQNTLIIEILCFTGLICLLIGVVLNRIKHEKN